MAVRMPAILNGQLKPEKPLKAVSLSLTVSLRDFSQARLTVSRSEQPVKTKSFINLYTQKGSAGVYRVTSQETSSEQGRTYTLTHAIDTLRDSVWNTQQTFEGTVQAFWTTVLYHQKTEYWQLGIVEKGGFNYKAAGLNYPKLSAAFTKFFQDNPNYYPEYDFSTTPWTLNIREMTEEVKGRFSVTRNAENCKITYNDKNMCNRLYLSVSTPQKVNGITKYDTMLKSFENAESIAEYGIIEQTAAVKTEEIKEGDYTAWANDFLKKYAQPECSVTVDAYEIWKQTGEIYDEAVVGKRARVHLPEHGVTTVQRIESIQYTDLINSPRAIVVSLATKQKTFTSTIANLEKEVDKVGGIAGGAALSAANAEEVTAWSLIMQKVEEAVDGTGIIALWETGISIDAIGGAKITSLSQGFDVITSEVMVNRSDIEANAKGIKLSVQKNGVIAAINLSSEEARIQAAKIVLDGYVTASQLQTAIADVNYQYSQAIETLLLDANQVTANFLKTSSLTLGDTPMSKKALTMGAVTFATSVLMPSTHSGDLDHSHSVTVTDDGKVTLGAAVNTEAAGNFKIADTKAYKDGVSAAKASVTLSSAGWISGVNTVSASNGKTFPVSLPAFSASADAFNAQHKAIVKFFTASVPNPLESIEVDASSVYEAGRQAGLAEADTTAAYKAGWDAARAEVKRLIYSTGENKRVDIYGPGSTVDSVAKFWTVDVRVGFTSHVANQTTKQATANIYANLRLGGSTALTETASNTISFGSGIM